MTSKRLLSPRASSASSADECSFPEWDASKIQNRSKLAHRRIAPKWQLLWNNSNVRLFGLLIRKLSLSLYTISLSLTVFLNLSILNSLFFLFYFSPSIFYSLHFTLSLFNSLSLSLSLSVTVLLNLSFFLSLSFLLSLSFPISIFLYLTLFFPFVYPSLCLLWTNPVIFFIDFRLFKHTLQILQHIGVWKNIHPA